MLPDQGLYEERYRLTGSVALSLAVSLGMLALALHASEGEWLALSVLAFVTVTVPALVTAVGRKVAFRADPLGITFGAAPLSWPGRDSDPVFIPWSDVDRASSCTAGREPGGRRTAVHRHPAPPRRCRACPAATSPPAAARCLAWPRAPPGKSSRGGSTASG